MNKVKVTNRKTVELASGMLSKELKAKLSNSVVKLSTSNLHIGWIVRQEMENYGENPMAVLVMEILREDLDGSIWRKDLENGEGLHYDKQLYRPFAPDHYFNFTVADMREDRVIIHVAHVVDKLSPAKPYADYP